MGEAIPDEASAAAVDWASWWSEAAMKSLPGCGALVVRVGSPAPTRTSSFGLAPFATPVTSCLSGPKASRAAVAVSSFVVDAGAYDDVWSFENSWAPVSASTIETPNRGPSLGSASNGVRTACSPAVVGWGSLVSAAGSTEPAGDGRTALADDSEVAPDDA